MWIPCWKLLAFLPSPIHRVYLLWGRRRWSSGGKYASIPIAPASQPASQSDRQTARARAPGSSVVFVNFVMSPKWRWSLGRFRQIRLQYTYESKLYIFLTSSFIFGYNILEPPIEIWRFFSKHFDHILAIENLNKHYILAVLIFNIYFWLYTASKKQRLPGRHYTYLVPT
jgi:hypothetical protein